ncbi:MAG: ribosome-binding factor [Acidobacteria bacterium]|jgi:ribosome-binding factor A|nr:ribosome-binding factor [Acidobacteriota bacterium]
MRRSERLGELLKVDIAEVVGFELVDPRLQSVIVTDVQVSENLRDAKVFVLVEGNDNEIKEAMKGLQRAATFVRQQVAMNQSLRYVPHLHFIRDMAEENASRVGEILEDLSIKGEFQERNEQGEGEK